MHDLCPIPFKLKDFISYFNILGLNNKYSSFENFYFYRMNLVQSDCENNYVESAPKPGLVVNIYLMFELS